jgi:Na+-transporting NADH:ubiquinone oxidoreductase subunit F
MAPIQSMLHQMKNTHSQRKTTFLFGGNTVRDIFMLEEMRQFEKDLPNFRFIPIVANVDAGDTWTGERGLVTEAVKRLVQPGPALEAYLCGSPGMIDATVAVLARKGMSDERIFFDKFS